MRSVNDNPIDSLGSIGSPIRQPAPAKPDTVRPFEQGDHSGGIGNQSKALDTLAEALRKQITPVSPGKAEEWEGMCLDEYGHLILSCI